MEKPSHRIRNSHWRRGKRGPSTPGRNKFKLLALIVLTAALLACLGYYFLRPLFFPAHHFFLVSAPPEYREELLLPDHPFPEGVAWISSSIRLDKSADSGADEFAESLGRHLDQPCSGTVIRRRDRVSVYIRAHGATFNNEPYLLFCDFDGFSDDSTDQQGCMLVDELLKSVDQCAAGVKLLILDVGHLWSDPWMGVIGNDFPDLLKDRVKRFEPERPFGVLVACNPGEICHVSWPDRQSVFGFYVNEGLRGHADPEKCGGNGGGLVGLCELLH